MKYYILKLREHIDFYTYLIHVDIATKIISIVTLISAVWTVISFSSSGFTGWGFYFGTTIFIVSLIVTFGTINTYGPSQDREYVSQKYTDLDVVNGAKPYPFSQIVPSQYERERGFYRPDVELNSGEYAIISDSMNAWLMNEKGEVKIKLRRSECYTFCDKDNTEKFKDQMSYLYFKVFGKTRTTNDSKYRISSEFEEGISSIQLSKVGYYDAIITNEAFRSSIWVGDNLSANVSSGKREAEKDLRSYFPVRPEELNGKMIHYLQRMDQCRVANHVGISTLVISSDNRPILFEQAKGMDLMEGKLVVSGSGSVDYADIDHDGTMNFLSAIRFSMAREFYEEGSQKSGWSDRRVDAISRIAERTMILGYFRWVDRCGKPEFMGVTKVDKTEDKIRADRQEVRDLDDRTEFPSVFKISDLRILYECIRDAKTERGAEKYEVGLSSAMVLWRLAQIADKDPSDRERQLVAEHLQIRNE